jgi:hypothetical protein
VTSSPFVSIHGIINRGKNKQFELGRVKITTRSKTDNLMKKKKIKSVCPSMVLLNRTRFDSFCDEMKWKFKKKKKKKQERKIYSRIE